MYLTPYDVKFILGGMENESVRHRGRKTRERTGSSRRERGEVRPSEPVPEEMTLRELRKARKLTQVRLAKQLGVTQDSVSRLESRSDVLLSTLRKTVEAMGGSLSLVAEFADRGPVVLAGIAEDEPGELPAVRETGQGREPEQGRSSGALARDLAGEAVDYLYVCNSATLERLVRSIGEAETVALDMEADSLHSYFEKVCLIQLSAGGEHFVVDPFVELDFDGLVEALAPKRLIVHGGNYDVRMMYAWKGFKPHGEVFDTMIAAQLLGIEQIGLASLVQRFFDITMTKDSQKSDWSRRPLSEKQLRYAVNDTRHLEGLAECLRGELRELGRVEWHRESCRAMAEAAVRDRPDDSGEAWRIKGAGRLSHRQLAYLRELWGWRDGRARRSDRPTFKVLGNRQLLELAQWVEEHPEESLDQGPKLPRNVVGSWRRTLEKSIARAAGMTPEEWPERRGLPGPKPPPIDPQKFDALRGECARVAGELEIAPSTLAPKAALEAILQQGLRTLDEIMSGAGLLRWQAELVRPVLETTVHTSRQTPH